MCRLYSTTYSSLTLKILYFIQRGPSINKIRDWGVSDFPRHVTHSRIPLLFLFSRDSLFDLELDHCSNFFRFEVLFHGNPSPTGLRKYQEQGSYLWTCTHRTPLNAFSSNSTTSSGSVSRSGRTSSETFFPSPGGPEEWRRRSLVRTTTHWEGPFWVYKVLRTG